LDHSKNSKEGELNRDKSFFVVEDGKEEIGKERGKEKEREKESSPITSPMKYHGGSVNNLV